MGDLVRDQSGKAARDQPPPCNDLFSLRSRFLGRRRSERRSRSKEEFQKPDVDHKIDSKHALPLRERKVSPISSDGEDDSLNSKTLQDLLPSDKRGKPYPVQKRSPEESPDDSRRFKQSRSPKAPGNVQLYSSTNEQKTSSGAYQTQVASGHGHVPSSVLGQTSRSSGEALSSELNARGRDSASDPNTKSHDGLDELKPPPDGGYESDDDPPRGDTSMLLQPDTRPITPKQLVNEVKGIYSGLVMVEKECVEIITQQASAGGNLSNTQWQNLIARHRTLLHEHHDFFLASQHPTASPALRRLAAKYAMPARIWRNGIHAFLELLRQQLPESYDHMLAFVYIAYSMMALLMESVPSFLETWIECLGDLARYRMAIEEIDIKDREIWSNVARMWYNEAADRSPNVGRIQHHLAVLARPNIVMQLFLYSKALISVVPFPNAKESIMLLFGPLLDKEKAETQYQKYSPEEVSLVTAWGIAFQRGSVSQYLQHTNIFFLRLESLISRSVQLTPSYSVSGFKTQGPEIASALIAGILDYGSDENVLWKMFTTQRETIKAKMEQEQKDAETSRAEARKADTANIDAANTFLNSVNTDSTTTKKATPVVPLDDYHIKESYRRKYWSSIAGDPSQDYIRAPPPKKHDDDSMFTSSQEVSSYSLLIWHQTTSIIASKIGDRNTVPYLHLTLAFLWSLSFVPGALPYLEAYVPWSKLVTYLNTLGRSGVDNDKVQAVEIPETWSGVGLQLPEDFLIRGLVWATYYYPATFFTREVMDDEDRQIDLPSQAAPRAERCLWLGVRIASLERYFRYDIGTKCFVMIEHVEPPAVFDSPGTAEKCPQKVTFEKEPEFDAVLVHI